MDGTRGEARTGRQEQPEEKRGGVHSIRGKRGRDAGGRGRGRVSGRGGGRQVREWKS